VKALNYSPSGGFEPYLAFNPTLSLIGAPRYNTWQTDGSITSNLTLHVNIGAAAVVQRIYYENFHESGAYTDMGPQHVTFWGANDAAAFAELAYAVDTNWTQLPLSDAHFLRHVAANQADPQYLLVTNALPYRYYRLKMADSYGNNSQVAIRRIELQVMV
jgi:hypothetical protein